MRGSVEKRSSLIHFDYLTASHAKIGGYDQLGGS